MTQFSRSMHVEMWGSGVEFYAATPMYVVSNLYKRKQGSLFAPMPIELVKGILSQIGKAHYIRDTFYYRYNILINGTHACVFIMV